MLHDQKLAPQGRKIFYGVVTFHTKMTVMMYFWCWWWVVTGSYPWILIAPPLQLLRGAGALVLPAAPSGYSLLKHLPILVEVDSGSTTE